MSALRLGGLLALPPLFWAGNFLVGRMMNGLVPPMTLLFWRWALAFVLILPFAWTSLRRDLPRYRAQFWRLFGAALSGIVAFNSFIYIGLHFTTASNALLLNSLIPVLILLAGAAFYGQRLNPLALLGVLLSFAGVLVILTQGDAAALLALELSRGDLIVFCALIAWTAYTFLLRGFSTDVDRIGLMTAQIAVGLVVLLPMMLAEMQVAPSAIWNTKTLSALAYLAVFPSILAYVFYTAAVARVGPTRAGLSIHLIPVFGVILAVALLGERLHLYHLAGVVAIGGGILLALRKA